MTFQKRKKTILELLEEKGSLEVNEFSEYLGVSGVTVRRDLNALADRGFIQRTHGGAMSLTFAAPKVDFASKATVQQEEKDHIAQIASTFIVDGDILFLDCGSTVSRLAPYLHNRKIKVITNSLPIMHSLINLGPEINVVGGELDQGRMAVHGSVAVQHISRYKATKAFIGVDGLSVIGGLTSNSEKEAEISIAMASHSRQVFLLCDSSKFGHDKYLQLGPVSMIDYLITDAQAPENILESFRKEGVRVVK